MATKVGTLRFAYGRFHSTLGHGDQDRHQRPPLADAGWREGRLEQRIGHDNLETRSSSRWARRIEPA